MAVIVANICGLINTEGI